jgi:hypothetical protein
MRRPVLLAALALVASLFLAPAAWAQQDMMMDESTMMNQDMMMDNSNMMDQSMMEQPKMMEKGKMEMPKTGGPVTLSAFLPVVAALMLGSGVLAYTVLRRR